MAHKFEELERKMSDEAIARSEEKYRQMTFEALADVDAGRTIDHSAVEEWAESINSDS